jgi:hypothetical protein
VLFEWATGRLQPYLRPVPAGLAGGDAVSSFLMPYEQVSQSMSLPDYSNPVVEQEWCDARRADLSAYLARAGVAHGLIGERPAWHIAPYVSRWAIESVARPEWIGWWVIAGNLPTDYISSADVAPRSIHERS